MARLLAMAAALALSATPLLAQDAGGLLRVELNKLEDGEGAGCRAYFLFRNQTDMTLEAFEMSLAILDPRGVIDRLLTIDAAPLDAARTTLKLFEIPETTCADVSEVIVHDIAACTPQNAEPVNCFGFLELGSLADAALVK